MTNQQGAPEALRFTKKPVTIEAIQWTGNNLREVITFTDGPPDTRSHHAGMAWEAYADLVARDGLLIYTLEDGPDRRVKHFADIGDWIIRGVKGEYYPCKPDIFEATYSPAALVEAQQLAPSAAAAVSDEDEALDLLATLFDAWENGTPCYEEPESSDGFLGHAFRLDDEVFHRCADLLNRRRGKQQSPTPQADSQPALLKECLSLLESFDYEDDEDSQSKAFFKAHINVDWFFHVKNLLERAARAPADSQPAWASQAVIEYRYTGGTRWCPLGPAERMKPNFDGVYRLQGGVFPVESTANSVLEDAARYEYLRDCTMGERNRLEHYSGPALDVVIDAARKQGANHD